MPSITGKVRRLSVEALTPNSYNYNEMQPFMFDKLVATIKANDFIDPIKVRTGNEKGKFKDGRIEIIDGYHRWKGAKTAGMTEVRVIDLGNVSDAKAKMLTINSNELHGERNEDMFGKLVREINDAGTGEIELLPLGDDELKVLLSESEDPDWDDLTGANAGGDNDDEGEGGEDDGEEEEGIDEALGIVGMGAVEYGLLLLRCRRLTKHLKKAGKSSGCLLAALLDTADAKHKLPPMDGE